MPLVRFLPPDDQRIRDTVLAIRDGLDDQGLILRYITDETDDGLHGEEGTFLICSFWMVAALSEIGEKAARQAALRAAARCLRGARPFRRGTRGFKQPAPRQLPPGLHPPRPDQRGLACDHRRASQRRRNQQCRLGLLGDAGRPVSDADQIRENISAVRARMAEACERSGRDPDSVRLLLATKTVGPGADQGGDRSR